MYLKVLDEKTIKFYIRYKLDTEHSLEFKFVSGQKKMLVKLRKRNDKKLRITRVLCQVDCKI